MHDQLISRLIIDKIARAVQQAELGLAHIIGALFGLYRPYHNLQMQMPPVSGFTQIATME